MRRWQAILILCLFWAAIYLPGLGDVEIKGEEGRRILPAVAMIESGDWIVPQIGGEAYLRKPPLINWLIAGSFKVCGVRNEWAARMPSVLAVLALGIALVSLSPSASVGLAAGLFAITNISMIDKGRLAEIEAVYVAFTGIAILLWLHFRARSDWGAWIGAFFLLALGLLAKGPTHLLFFYGIVGAVLWSEGEFRKLFSLPHLAGLALMLGMFALWAVPYFRATAHLNAAGVWTEQMREHAGGGGFDLIGWLTNFPRGLSNYLPWVLLLPALWRTRKVKPWFGAVRNSSLILFCLFLIIPGVLPRYTMPLIGPVSLLLAIALENREARWPWLRRYSPVRLAVAGGVLASVFIAGYTLVAVPRMRAAENIRPWAERINATVPAGAPLHVVDPGFQPGLFYVRPRIVYAQRMDRIPPKAEAVLIREKSLGKFRRERGAQVLARFPDKAEKVWCVVRLNGVEK